MNRHKKGAMPEITRDIYKKVKKLDRQQFVEFCATLYYSGIEDGKASVPGIDAEKIYEVIAGVKGIGPKKMADIRTAIEAEFGSVEKEVEQNAG